MSDKSATRPKSLTSQRLALLPDLGIRKLLDLLNSVGEVLSLGIGEPDFATPWHICEAAIHSLEDGSTMYTPTAGFIELRRLLAQRLEDWYGLSYDPQKEAVITVGVSQALDLALRAILDPGDEVIMSDPSYLCYQPCVIMAGGKPVLVPTGPEIGFRLEAAEVEARITPRTKVILFGYPANPTGAVMSREDLIRIGEVAAKHDLLVISDEIYARLVYEVEHVCFPALPGMKERTILLGGFSKSYAMTGWRLGYALGHPELIDAMTSIHQYTMLSASSIAQNAALEALKNGEPSVVEMVADYDRRRRIIVKGLNDIGLDCFEPRGAFYTFPSIRVTGLSSEEFAEKLLVEERVVVVPGTAFGTHGEGFVRCCYATALSDIEEALRRMGRFVERHRK